MSAVAFLETYQSHLRWNPASGCGYRSPIAIFGVAADSVAGSPVAVCVGGIGLIGLEVTQVGFQRLRVRDHQGVQQPVKMLVVIVIPLGVVILRGQVACDTPVAAIEVKVIIFASATGGG